MPFESQAQRGFMYAKHPKLAKEFEEETPKNAKLPEHVKKMAYGGMIEDELLGVEKPKIDEDPYFQGKPAWDISVSASTDTPKNYAEGGVVTPKKDKEWGPMVALRNYIIGHHGNAAQDQQMMSDADKVDMPEPPKEEKDSETAHMASGGLIPYNAESSDTMNFLQPQGSGMIAPSATPVPPRPVFNPNSGAPPALPPAMPPPQVAKAPDTSVSDLQNQLASYKEGLNKYGPEQQLAVEQEISKNRTGLGRNLANAGAGLADALMQGVARAGPSNFQANLQNRQDKTEEGMRSAFEKANTGKMAQMKAEMELTTNDPESPLSKSAQRANRPTLKALGLTDADINSMPASLIAEATTKRLTLEEIKAKAEESRALHEQTMAFQNASLANTAKHQAMEEKATKEAHQQEAAGKLVGRGVGKRVVDFVTQNPSIKVLENQAVGFEPDVMAYAQAHGITPEQAQMQKDRRMKGK